MVLRLLCGAWLVPATSLIWIGLATAGLRTISEASLAEALGRTQAAAVILAVFTLLIGASVFVRQTAPLLPADESAPTDGLAGGPSGPWLAVHAVLLLVALPAVPLGLLVASLAPLLWTLAALAGFAGALALPRALLRFPEAWSGPLAALAVGIVFQLTVGWLHVVHPVGVASPVLVAEGLILAWAAASAARVDPFAAANPATEPVEVVDPAQLATGDGGFSRASAPPSFAESMAGR
jgi:hypothetical protein